MPVEYEALHIMNDPRFMIIRLVKDVVALFVFDAHTNSGLFCKYIVSLILLKLYVT